MREAAELLASIWVCKEATTNKTPSKDCSDHQQKRNKIQTNSTVIESLFDCAIILIAVSRTFPFYLKKAELKNKP